MTSRLPMGMVNGLAMRDYLTMRRANPAIFEFVMAELHGLPLREAHRSLSKASNQFAWEDLALLLGAFLHFVSNGNIVRDRVRAWLKATDSMRLDHTWRQAFVIEELGVDEAHLACLGVLGLPLNCDLEQVKHAHREQVKLHHPDRVRHMAQEFIDLAERRTSEIHQARDRLFLTLEEVELELEVSGVVTEVLEDDSLDTLVPD